MSRRTFRKKSNNSKRKRTLRKNHKKGGEREVSNAFFSNLEEVSVRNGINKQKDSQKTSGIGADFRAKAAAYLKGADSRYSGAKLITGISAIQWVKKQGGRHSETGIFLIKSANTNEKGEVNLKGIRLEGKRTAGRIHDDYTYLEAKKGALFGENTLTLLEDNAAEGEAVDDKKPSIYDIFKDLDNENINSQVINDKIKLELERKNMIKTDKAASPPPDVRDVRDEGGA